MIGNKFVLIGILGLFVLPMSLKAQKQKKIKGEEIAIGYLNNSFDTYDKIQKTIWSTPELGFLEVKSSALLQAHLADNGFKVEKGVVGIPTAFVATYGSGSPVIGILAEFDALNGLSQDTVPYQKALIPGGNGHGCGHQLLGTGAVAGAIAIKKWLEKAQIKGTLKVFGTPAEEGGGGKVFFAQGGLFNGVDAVLDWHPASRNAVRTETSLARISIIYHFSGKAAHAAGNPEKGRSALDGVEAMNQMVNALREHIPSDARIHYVITNGGGLSPNVVPAEAEVSYYVRAKNTEELFDILKRVDNAADGAALGTGTTVTKNRLGGAIYPLLLNKPFTKLIQKNLERVGGIEWDERESAYAKKIAETTNTSQEDLDKVKTVKKYDEDSFGRLSPGSTDVADVSWNVPVGSFVAATFVPGSPGHSWQNVAAGGTSIGTKGLLNASKVFALTAIDLFSDPTLLEPIKTDFNKSRGKDFKYTPIVPDKGPELDYRVIK
ncbi:amidohydrolase [Parabacteroides sp. Marseille-P3160]|uniref:amidohydrolase n=1 Tax=Parabacteroides sp. Marseille-P3160 TaxID=1917887 RepID=UPI0009BC59C1|nr:amidohydrolase [Parabacteroides sp. Marseille-P3160]